MEQRVISKHKQKYRTNIGKHTQKERKKRMTQTKARCIQTETYRSKQGKYRDKNRDGKGSADCLRGIGIGTQINSDTNRNRDGGKKQDRKCRSS